MTRTPPAVSKSIRGLALLTISALALTACSAPSDNQDPKTTPSNTEDTTSQAGWPRTFENADGTTTEIPEQPKSIVSTSVSTSGTLLAIDAPLAASGSAGNGQFFAQWADVAEERGVKNLWPVGKVDLEAVYTYEPDLIVVAATGNDSVVDQVAELQEIAPTIVIDYGGQSWQDLAEQLGEATGLEEQAAASVADYDDYVTAAAKKITVPEGTANIVSFNGAGEGNPIGRVSGPHATILEALGFTVEDPNPEWHTQGTLRDDFVWADYERLTELTSETTFILSQDNEGAQAFATDPVLANLPSVKDGQVYGLGLNSFRVDKFSATEIVDGIVANFGK